MPLVPWRKLQAGILANNIAARIRDGALTAGSLLSDVIQDSAITNAKIATGAVTADSIASGTITASEIAAGTITATEIAAGTITANEIAAGEITSGEITVATLDALTADMGTLTSGTISLDSGAVVLNSSGITIDKSSASSYIIFKNGSGTLRGNLFTRSSDDVMALLALNVDLYLGAGSSKDIIVRADEGKAFRPAVTDDVDVGTSTYKFRTGAFSGVVSHADPSLASDSATKSYTDKLSCIWSPASTGTGALATLGSGVPVTFLDQNEHCSMSFYIPSGYGSLTKAVIIVSPSATSGTWNLDIFSDYGASGENYNNHSSQDTSSTYSLTAGKISEIDVSGIISSLAAGDTGGVQIQNLEIDPFYVYGLFMEFAG